MDLILLIGIAIALLVILATLIFLQRKNAPKDERKPRPQPQQGIRPDGLNRRAQIARNQRNRLRQVQNVAVNANADDNEDVNALNRNENDDNDDNSGDDLPRGAVLDDKMGAKKRAKMEAKEQKRLMREQELKMREERKVKEAKEEEERKKLEEREAEEERKKEEAERLAREERERKEYEEYLKLKATFSVEEEGFDEDDDADEKANLLADFIKYIKDNKVVVLEDVAVEFKMKTQQVIDRIQELQANGTLTGVIDDRGKFIYVSEDELAAVVKFIKQSGRISIAELAECSNKLINLTPETST